MVQARADRWEVRQGELTVVSLPDRDRAIEAARDLARKMHWCEVVILGAGGLVESREAFGGPSRPR
jgi:hypothetical protein